MTAEDIKKIWEDKIPKKAFFFYVGTWTFVWGMLYAVASLWCSSAPDSFIDGASNFASGGIGAIVARWQIGKNGAEE